MDEKLLSKTLKGKKLHKLMEALTACASPALQKLGKHLHQLLNAYKKEDILYAASHLLPGNQILFTGFAGLSGSLFLAQEMESNLVDYFSPSFERQCLALPFPEPLRNGLMEELQDLALVLPLGEGGLSQTLFDLGKEGHRGFRIRMDEVPVKQETVEICEYLDLNPFSMFSGGCCCIITSKCKEVTSLCREYGLMPVNIGTILDSHEMILSCQGEYSLLNHPGEDELLRLLKAQLTIITSQFSGEF